MMPGPLTPDFPAEHLFKIIGPGDEGFPDALLAAVRRVVPGVGRDSVKIRPSREGNYQAVSIVARLESHAQLLAAYQEIRTVPGIQLLL